jgi:protein-disulfide isomerase
VTHDPDEPRDPSQSDEAKSPKRAKKKKAKLHGGVGSTEPKKAGVGSPEPKKKGGGRTSSARAVDDDEVAASSIRPRDRAPATARSNTAIYAALVAFALGGGGGWLLRDRQAKSELDPKPEAAAPEGSAAAGDEAPTGPCADWSKAICDKAGAESEGCDQAKSAAKFLPTGACQSALAEVPATVKKLESARSVCTDLVERLCNDIGKDTETCKMVRDKTASFPTSRCKEMAGNYEAVVEQLKEMEKQNAPISPELAAKQAGGDGPAFGPPDAKVAIVEYSDFECPYCSKAAEAVTKLKKKYGKSVRFVFRQFPLSFHQNAKLAAEASLAAHAQGKFWEYHDRLFANQRELDRASLERYATEVGLDMAKFKKALDDHVYAKAVEADMKLGEELGVSGTPTMIIGTQRAENPSDFEALSKAIDAQLTAAGVEVPKDG